MGFFRYLTLLFCLCTITLTQAQRYEVDCLVSSEIKAVATDKPTEFDGTRTVLYLRNGTLVNVVGRKVAGTDGQEASHLKQTGDTLDVRQIKAVVEYDGKLQNVSILHQGDRSVELWLLRYGISGGAHATHAAQSAVTRRCRGLTSGVTAHAVRFCTVLFKDRLRFGKTLSSKLECFSLTLHYL